MLIIYLYIRNYHKWLHIIKALGGTGNDYKTTIYNYNTLKGIFFPLIKNSFSIDYTLTRKSSYQIYLLSP